MPQCSKCGESYTGNDCSLCKTTTGINLSELGVIITCLRESDEDMGILLEDADTGKRYPVALPMCRVGRDPQNDIIITGDNGVSRNQFVITHEGGYFYLMDLGSKNGTLLNNRTTNDRTPLQDGDLIQLGQLRLKFVAEEDVAFSGDHNDFLRYLESKPESAEGDSYEPAMTMDTVLPEEARLALEKTFKGSKGRYTAGGNEMKAEEKQYEMERTEVAEERDDEEMGGQDSDEGAEREMTTAQEDTTTSAPGYSPKYMQEEIARLEKEITTLNSVVLEAKKKIQDCESRIKMMVALQKSLLSATGEELVEGCARVLQLMGCRVNRGDKDKHELLLTSETGGLVIAGISWASPQAVHADLGKLVISQVFHWCKQKAEPKGILIVNAHAGGSATDTEFSSEIEEYAKHKNVCVMTTLQLLYMFRELNQNIENADRFQKELFSTVGLLHGFGAEVSETPVAA
jgi:pSer/pThr/pTyr-binding forkhead associated (FHA) protein